MGAEPVETRVAVLHESIKGCQAREEECRQQNHADHVEIFGRINVIERNFAVLAGKIATWAAIGSVVGGAAAAAVMRLFSS